MNRDSKLHGGTHVLQTPPGENDQWTYEKRTHWWEADALKSWFLSKGYTLYNRTRVDGEPTRFMFPACGKEPDEHSFPYAHQHSNVIDDDWVQGPSFTTWCGYRNVIVYAQDSQGRHVAIKAVKDRSEEYQILRYLKEHLIPTTMDDFENVLPVLELLSYNEYWFAVMPRWGDVPLRPLARTMEEILQIIHALLKGLNCLHKHKIAHLDIKADNILVSHFGKRLTDGNNEFRATLRSQGRLTYAFFDFDVAAIFPPT
ncbi:hypothetical protein D9615_006222 [Tricholomella constricta]|uniref:Protein kinase domain-containing protein n=1 Tax=Tricholomella constricta TaxID=117010 RepID=A0A8H5HBC4_9AGAR|nr:hypothetical protein D9615_006222 [Tricholomella constricta]